MVSELNILGVTVPGEGPICLREPENVQQPPLRLWDEAIIKEPTLPRFVNGLNGNHSEPESPPIVLPVVAEEKNIRTTPTAKIIEPSNHTKIDSPKDEFSAMNDVYQIMRHFDELARKRINGWVASRIKQEEEHHIDDPAQIKLNLVPGKCAASKAL